MALVTLIAINRVWGAHTDVPVVTLNGRAKPCRYPLSISSLRLWPLWRVKCDVVFAASFAKPKVQFDTPVLLRSKKTRAQNVIGSHDSATLRCASRQQRRNSLRPGRGGGTLFWKGEGDSTVCTNSDLVTLLFCAQGFRRGGKIS